MKRLFALSGLKVGLLVTFIVLGLFLYNNYISVGGSFLNLLDKVFCK